MKKQTAPLVLVTGASGFIGKHLTRRLLKKGYRVRAVYRNTDISGYFEDVDTAMLEIQQADLLRQADVARILKGCDVVIHTAALAIDWGPFELFKQNNYDATVRLIDEAERAGCDRFIYISTAAVHGFGKHVGTNESGPYYTLKYPYPITKRMAEEYVVKKNRENFTVVIIRPANAYGPGDRTSTYEMYRQILSGVMGYIGRGTAYTCPVFIDDLCEALTLTLTAENIGGEIIIVSDGQKVPWKDYVNRMFEVVGNGRKPVGLPTWLAYLSAYFMKFMFQVLKLKGVPKLTLYRVEQGSQHYHFDNAKAKRLLGFEPTVFYREGLEKTGKAFLEENGKAKE